MDPTIHVPPGPVHVENEGLLHYLAREGRVALRWTIGISLVLTLVVMVSPFLFLAPIPALVLLASYVVFMLTREVERRSDPQTESILSQRENAGETEVMEDAAEMHQFAPETMRIVKRESRAGVMVLAAVMVVALLIAAFFLPWEIFALGAFVVTAYMLLVAAPVLLGWLEHDIEVQQGAPEPIPPSPQVHG